MTEDSYQVVYHVGGAAHNSSPAMAIPFIANAIHPYLSIYLFLNITNTVNGALTTSSPFLFSPNHNGLAGPQT